MRDILTNCDNCLLLGVPRSSATREKARLADDGGLARRGERRGTISGPRRDLVPGRGKGAG